MGLLTEETRADVLPPIPVGALGSLIPKPQRCYIGFGDPIDLSAEKGKRLGKQRLRAIRSQVAEQIEIQLAELLFAREQHKGKDSLLRRIFPRHDQLQGSRRLREPAMRATVNNGRALPQVSQTGSAFSPHAAQP